jgi:hypothetical protein
MSNGSESELDLMPDRHRGVDRPFAIALGALTAVRNWRFLPARRGTEAIADWVDVPVRFRLQD